MLKLLLLCFGSLSLAGMELDSKSIWAKTNSNGDLQLATKKYKNKNFPNVVVKMIAVVHVAEENFYKHVDEDLNGYKVFYEDMHSVKELHLIENSKSIEIIDKISLGEDAKDIFVYNQILNPSISQMAKRVSSFLGLSFQLDALTYHAAAELIHADLKPNEEEKREFFQRFTKAGIYQQARYLLPRKLDSPKGISSLLHPDDVNDIEELKEILSECKFAYTIMSGQENCGKEIINYDDVTAVKYHIFNYLKLSLALAVKQRGELQPSITRKSIIDDTILMAKKHEECCTCYDQKSCQKKLVWSKMMVDQRNKIAINCFDELLQKEIEKNQDEIKIAIIYGASHLSDFEQHLFKLGFGLSEEDWFTAIYK